MARQVLTLVAMVALLCPLASSVIEDVPLRHSADVPGRSSFEPVSHYRGRPDIEAVRLGNSDTPYDHFSTAAKDKLHLTATAHLDTKAKAKEHSSLEPFTPSQPVSFSSFSFIPSQPPPGADTYFREDTLGLTRSHDRQVPRAPPIPRPVQIDSRGPFVHYADRYETEEEDKHYTPDYEERQHFPDYDNDYESVQYDSNGRNPEYDDYEGEEYHASPPVRGHQYQVYDEGPQHHHHSPPTRDSRPSPHLNTSDEEERDAAPCKIVKKDDMTCEVCRDDEGSYSEHCSHSTRSDQDETYPTGRRHSKRDTTAPAPIHTPSSQARPPLIQLPRSRVDRPALVQKAQPSPILVTATTAAKDTHYQGSARDPTTTTTTTTTRAGAGEAQSRQEMGFGFDFDDHDFTFHDHDDFSLHHEPDWYHMTAPRTSLDPLRPSFKDTHAHLMDAMERFVKKDKSSCKKVEKHGMTCYVCPRGSGTDEECMYASHKPDGHDLHYSEETTYGSSSSSSSSHDPQS